MGLFFPWRVGSKPAASGSFEVMDIYKTPKANVLIKKRISQLLCKWFSPLDQELPSVEVRSSPQWNVTDSQILFRSVYPYGFLGEVEKICRSPSSHRKQNICEIQNATSVEICHQKSNSGDGLCKTERLSCAVWFPWRQWYLWDCAAVCWLVVQTVSTGQNVLWYSVEKKNTKTCFLLYHCTKEKQKVVVVVMVVFKILFSLLITGERKWSTKWSCGNRRKESLG